MTTELDHFKQIIHQITTESATPEQLQLLQTETERLPDLISSGIFSLQSGYHIQNHICLAQAILTTKADELYRHLRNTPNIPAKKALILTLHLLDTLGARFPEHWNSINPIPKALQDKLIRKYQPVKEKLQGKLERYGIKPELIEIVLYPLRKLLNQPAAPSYNEYNYLTNYLTTLTGLNLRGKTAASAESLLCARLITINYNQLAFMDYLITKRASELRSVFTKPEKFRILNKMRSRLKSVSVKEGLAFDADFPLLKDAIHQWIEGKEEEIKLSRERFKQPASETRQRQKMYVSAGILALMARLCKIVGLCEATRTQIISHMTETYTSKKVDSITKTSFTNLWKKPSEPVARALRRILNHMLAEIQLYLDAGRFSDQPVKEEAKVYSD